MAGEFPPPSKTVYLDWNVEDPSRVKGTAAEVQAAYEKTYQSLNAHIRDLVEAHLASLPEHAGTGRDLMAAADVALYEAKRDGRNRVRLYRPAPAPSSALR